MTKSAPKKYGMGAPARRIEDKALVTGAGHFVDDYEPPGTLKAFVLRSSMAHARIAVTDTSGAKSMPGVHLVMTAADLDGIGGLPCNCKPRKADGSLAAIPPRPLLAADVVRHVGDPIAFVVADDIETARDASEAIEVDYEPLGAVADMRMALADNAPLVWPDHTTNIAFFRSRGDADAAAAAFADAAQISKITIVNNRVVSNYMETRGVVAEYDAGSGRYTLTLGTQGGHSIRDFIARDILAIDPGQIRVITPDVGGGFGTKQFVYHEYPLAALAASRLGRPVKWIGDRSEHFVLDSHGRDNLTTAEMAMDEDGRFLGLRVDVLANMGAYLAQEGPDIPVAGLTMLPGVYHIPAMSALLRGVYTNTVPTDAYRGAGRPEAAYMIERLVDSCGRDTGLGPVEIRRRNFIAPELMPYKTQAGRTYDSGAFARHFDRALAVADAAGFAARRAAAETMGRLRGLGLSTYIEACAFPGHEPATLTLDADGSVTLLIGTQSNGQGHATAYAQFIGEHLGLDYDRVNLVQGDTDRVAEGSGTGGSRSIPIGAVSVDRAAKKLAEQIKQLAAERLEVSVGDLELSDGVVRVSGTDRSVGLAELAAGATDTSLLTAVGDFEQQAPTYPNGTHICEVEIDPQTGMSEIVGYWIVDDFGATVNPLLLAGQVHGGSVQGIGQALYEHTVYGDDGQLQTASLLDYCLPRAKDVPSFYFETCNVPCKSNALGIKGAGEAGAVGSSPAVVNAVVDALHEAYGIETIDMPATPARLWSVIQAATQGASARDPSS